MTTDGIVGLYLRRRSFLAIARALSLAPARVPLYLFLSSMGMLCFIPALIDPAAFEYLYIQVSLGLRELKHHYSVS